MITTTWHNAVSCNDLYKDSFGEQFVSESFTEFWLCPDVANVTLNNDVTTITLAPSQSFGMVVNDCTTAKEIDEKYNLVPYTDVDCDTTLEEKIDHIVVYTKFLTQSSQPDYFLEHKEMRHIFI